MVKISAQEIVRQNGKVLWRKSKSRGVKPGDCLKQF